MMNLASVQVGYRPISLCLVLVGIAGIASAQEKPSLKWPTVAIIAASAFDELSTEYNLSQGHELLTMRDGSQVDVNSREKSPQIAWLQGNRPAMYAFSTGLTVAGVLALRALGTHGHPRLAKYGLYAWSAVRIDAAIGNVQAGNQHRAYKQIAVSVHAF